ncbi:MAG TPA: NAD-dependent epimerase/dehydratase family protein [Burkholderiales bacterium]|jgi:UDP-glucose 4-epimerase|nr:NAD-dependent epimerase/dehydratase family protein [Burkholderiales bacterium]
MDVVVSGANGFIGQSICAALLACGDQVTAVIRQPTARQALPAGALPLLLQEPANETLLREHLPPAQCLVHAAGNASLRGASRHDNNAQSEVKLARALARTAAARGYRRFVFISSVAVLGTSDGGTPFTEAAAVAPGWPYARVKFEAEQAVLEVGAASEMETVILRPPMVYGPGNRGNFPRLVRWVASGMPLPLKLAQNARSYIYVGNLADAAALCARHPGVANRLFLLADARDWSTLDLVRVIAREAQCPARLWPAPLGLLRAMGQATGRSQEVGSLINSRRIDAALIHAATGWVPPHEAGECLARTVRWCLENPVPGPTP